MPANGQAARQVCHVPSDAAAGRLMDEQDASHAAMVAGWGYTGSNKYSADATARSRASRSRRFLPRPVLAIVGQALAEARYTRLPQLMGT
jgi:hypothetical protein